MPKTVEQVKAEMMAEVEAYRAVDGRVSEAARKFAAMPDEAWKAFWKRQDEITAKHEAEIRNIIESGGAICSYDHPKEIRDWRPGHRLVFPSPSLHKPS